MMINRIVAAYTRHYRDTGSIVSYIEWIDDRGNRGRTEGHPDNIHICGLLSRAVNEGVKPALEIW